MFERFTKSARLAVFFARYEALASGAAEIQPHDFLAAILCIHPEMALTAQIEPSSPPPTLPRSRDDVPLSESSKRVLRSASEQARDFWRRETGCTHGAEGQVDRGGWLVDPRHILLSVMQERGANTEELRARLFGPGAGVPTTRMRDGLPRHTGKLSVAILCARYEARRLASASIRPEHLLLGLFFASVQLRKPKATEDSFDPIGLIRREIVASGAPAAGEPGPIHPDARRAFAYAAEEAAALGREVLGTGDLLLGLLRLDCCFVRELLNSRGIQLTTARAALSGPDLL